MEVEGSRRSYPIRLQLHVPRPEPPHAERVDQPVGRTPADPHAPGVHTAVMVECTQRRPVPRHVRTARRPEDDVVAVQVPPRRTARQHLGLKPRDASGAERSGHFRRPPLRTPPRSPRRTPTRAATRPPCAAPARAPPTTSPPRAAGTPRARELDPLPRFRRRLQRDPPRRAAAPRPPAPCARAPWRGTRLRSRESRSRRSCARPSTRPPPRAPRSEDGGDSPAPVPRAPTRAACALAAGNLSGDGISVPSPRPKTPRLYSRMTSPHPLSRSPMSDPLRNLSDDPLLTRFRELARRDQALEAELLAHLGVPLPVSLLRRGLELLGGGRHPPDRGRAPRVRGARAARGHPSG